MGTDATERAATPGDSPAPRRVRMARVGCEEHSRDVVASSSRIALIARRNHRGRVMTPGREEEWTLSVAHSVEDADTYVTAFEEMAHDLVA